MNRLLLLLACLVVAAPVHAAERHYVVTSFDRVRVDGPFEVHLTTREAPAATADGSPRATDRVSIRVEGTTLIVSVGSGGRSEIPAHGSVQGPGEGKVAAPIIRLSTQGLRGATVVGGGSLMIDGAVAAQRIDLYVTGSGTLAAAALDADQLNATLLGSGTMTLGGRGGRVRLLASGSGMLDAAALRGDDVMVRLDGSGSALATARYTANATSTGAGAVTIYGKPECKVKATVGGPISCGEIAAPPVR